MFTHRSYGDTGMKTLNDLTLVLMTSALLILAGIKAVDAANVLMLAW